MKEMKASKPPSGKSFGVKDNTHASPVKSISTESEKADLGRVKPYSSGNKGYPSQALENSI